MITVKADPSLFPNPADRVMKSWAARYGGDSKLYGQIALCYLEPRSLWPVSLFTRQGLPVELHHFHVERHARRNGLGARLLRTALAWAQRHEYAVICCPQPYGRGKPPEDALLALYMDHGFLTAAPGVLVWYP